MFQSTLPARAATPLVCTVPLIGSFQSTLPARAATVRAMNVKTSRIVSIHAARAGSDRHAARSPQGRRRFNPRCPRGQRLAFATWYLAVRMFQSTLPARAATPKAAVVGTT